MLVGDLAVAFILAIVQGLTEWLPVSSSGHLVLVERMLGYSGGLEFEVALHFGTLMAVFVYFGKDVTDILRDLLLGRWKSEHGKMGLLLIVASVPAAIVGFLVMDFFDSVLTNLGVVAVGFGITSMFLFIAATYDFKKLSKKVSSLSYGKGFLIGIAQALAIIPGISRSGATISSGILSGLDEKAAMKFAFLMSIPVIFGASVVSLGNATLPSELIWSSFVSFLVGLATIHVLFKYVLVKRKNLLWFGIYCLVLALGVGGWVIFN